jgi:hypothetical protein
MADDQGMRATFAHDAQLALGPDADERAPGAAVTVALCGSWDHEGPCPVAPHHTSTRRHGDDLAVHVLFAVEPGDEDAVRSGIVAALSDGHHLGPDGRTTRWRLVRHTAGEVGPDEQEHAARLAEGS